MRKYLYILIILLISVINLSADEWTVQYVTAIEENVTAPTSLSIGNNNISILEPFEKQLKVFNSNGMMLSHLILEGDASALTRLSDNEYLYCDETLNQVTIVDISFNTESDYFSSIHTFEKPIDIDISGENLFILDAGRKQVLTYNTVTHTLSSFYLKNTDNLLLEYPSAFCYEQSSNRFYIINQISCEVWVFSATGDYLSKFGDFGGATGEISRTGDIAIDNQGLVYITDRYQHRVVVYKTDGTFIGNIDNFTDNNSSLFIPSGIAIDNNLIYVASTENKSVQVFYSYFKPTVYRYNSEPVFPLENDVIQIDEVKFISETPSLQDNELILGFDFQLFTSLDTSIVFDRIDSLPADKIYDSVSTRWIYQSEWIPNSQLSEDQEYFWRSRVVSDQQIGDWSSLTQFSTVSLPKKFTLHQNYPNPFNPSTKIRFELPKKSKTVLNVYNITGQLVGTLINSVLDAGTHEIEFSSNQFSIASGIYFYRLETPDFENSKKMVLIK